MRTTRRELYHHVDILRNRGNDININSEYGKYRITENNESRNVSPLLKAPEMVQWLDGFRAAQEHIEARIRAAVKHAILELKQLHSHYQPECKEGCPTLTYIKELEALNL